MLERLKTINREYLLKMAASIAMLVLISSAIEYFGFGHKLNSLEGGDKGISSIKNSDIVADKFILNEKGEFVSQGENAFLVLPTKGKYINNLELGLGENPNYNITVEYVDPKTDQKIILEPGAKGGMKKNHLTFLRQLVFNIENSPEKIIIQTSDPQAIILDIKIDNSYHFNSYRFLFVFLAGVLMLCFFVFRKKVGKNPEYIFVAVALICGTLISFSETKSFVSWDEFIHYKKADNLSLKSLIRKNIEDIFARNNAVPASYSIKEQESLNAFLDNNFKKEVKKKKTELSFSIVDSYNRLGYIPSAVALFFGRLLRLPYHIVFMLGRWINILLYSLVVFFAIRKLKTGKMIMALVALLPTAIFLAANYGYDSWITAFTLLGLAYLFSELQQPDKKITWQEVIIIIGALVIGLGPKPIYFPLLFLVFLLKPSKFSSLKQYKKFILAGVFSILLVVSSFILPFLMDVSETTDRRGSEAANSVEQVRFILSEPLAYAKILVNFMKDYINPVNAGGFVAFFAYLGMMKGFWILMALLAIAVFTDKNEFDKETSNFKTRLMVISVYLSTVALISTALYVSFTAVRSATIAGVQPRYLIPLVFPLLFILGSSRIKNPINKNIYNSLIFATISIVLLQGIWDLIIKNYF